MMVVCIDRHDRSVLALAAELVHRQSACSAVVQWTSPSQSLGFPERQVQSPDRMGDHETTACSIRAMSQVPSSLQQYFKDCQNDYSIGNEEQRLFEPGWTNATSQVSNASIQRAFQYQSGGYVYDFRGRLADLQETSLSSVS